MATDLFTESAMDFRDQRNILKIIDETGLFSQIENMTLIEFREYLEEKGFCNLYDLVTISLLVFGFLTGKGIVTFKDIDEDIELLEAKSMMKYKLTKDEISTLKMIADGLTNQEIADRLKVITIDGVAKRVGQILVKLDVSNRIQASVKAAKEGLV